MQSFWGLAVSSKFQQSLFHFYLLYFSPRRFDEPSSWHGKRLFSLVLIQLQRSDKYSKPFAISPLQHWLGAVPNWESLLWTRRIHAGRKCVWLVLNLSVVIVSWSWVMLQTSFKAEVISSCIQPWGFSLCLSPSSPSVVLMQLFVLQCCKWYHWNNLGSKIRCSSPPPCS